MVRYFIYCRKSTESEDRQVLSIDSQIAELKRLALARGFSIAEVLTEARSAKAPGRPVFNDLMQRLYRAEAQGILCWKLDRLARNPVDGGTVIWAMKQHGLEIVTPTQTYRHADDNTILLYIEFGMAQKFIDDLSRNVKRGIRAKLERGWYPTVVPLGYLNNPARAKGDKDIIKDTERFPLIRRMWDLMLTGHYSPAEIRKIANEKWGLRTRPMKRLGGKPISRSTIYRIFTDSFYYGTFEYPAGSGQWWKGAHPPMITENEYDRVQVLLGRKGKPRPVKHIFPLAGLIRCGACAAAVTAEEKRHLVCSSCRLKFSSPNKDRCPRCRIPVESMTAPRRRQYTYYHCTKRIDRNCPERTVRAEVLDAQIESFLARIEISDDFRRWATAYVHELAADEQNSAAEISGANERALAACAERLNRLVTVWTAPGNADGHLLSDAEYERARARLLEEKRRLEELSKVEVSPDRLAERAAHFFDYAYHARNWYLQGDVAKKREIVSEIGSNLSLKGKTLRIEAAKPFEILANGLSPLRGDPRPFEPRLRCMNRERNEACTSSRPTRRRGRYNDRTLKALSRRIARAIYTWIKESPEEVRNLPLPPDDSSVTDQKAA